MTNNEESNNYHQSGPQGVGHMENSVLKGHSKVIGRIAKATTKVGLALGLIGLGFFVAKFDNIDWLNNAQKIEVEKPVDASGTSGANLTIANDIAGDNSGSSAVPQTSSNNKEANNNNNVINGDNNEVTNAGEINHNYQKEKEVRVVRGDGNNPVAIYSSQSSFADDMSNVINALPVLFNKDKDIVDFTNEVAETVFSSTQTWLFGGTAIEELPVENLLDSEDSEGNSLLDRKPFKLGFKTTKVRVLEGEHKGMVGWVSSSVLKTEKRPTE